MLTIGGFPIVGLDEEEEGIRLVPHTHGDAYPWWSDTTKRVLEVLLPDDVMGKTVVDFGCGASAILGLAANWQDAASVTFVENHAELAQIAQQQLEANGISGKVLAETHDSYDFMLANLGNALDVGEASKLAAHGIGTDEQGEVIRW